MKGKISCGKNGKGRAMAEVTGGCHCGAIKYTASNPDMNAGYCECNGCQKATGALRVPFVHVPDTGFAITHGNPSEFKAEVGDRCDEGVWRFCQNCGTQLFWKGRTGDRVAIFAGTLDDTSLVQVRD